MPLVHVALRPLHLLPLVYVALRHQQADGGIKGGLCALLERQVEGDHPVVQGQTALDLFIVWRWRGGA